MRSSANFRIVFSESQNTSPLDAELGPDFNANDHSRSFNVIRFGVNGESLRGYIVQYNCGLECEGLEDIERKKRKSPFTTTPLSFDAPFLANPANIHINLTLLETRIPGQQFCRCQYIGSSSIFLQIVLSESQKRQFIRCRARNRF